jgi:hypothetical protein
VNAFPISLSPNGHQFFNCFSKTISFLLEPIGDIPPAEYEAVYYQNQTQAMAA